jgi:hypothetical protein
MRQSRRGRLVTNNKPSFVVLLATEEYGVLHSLSCTTVAGRTLPAILFSTATKQ